MPIFYATAEGIVFDSAAAQEVEASMNNNAHDSKYARDRLSDKLADMKLREEEERQQQQTDDTDTRLMPQTATDSNNNNNNADLSLHRVEDQLRARLHRQQTLQTQHRDNQVLARLQARTSNKHGNATKAIASQYSYRPDAADNAERRAIVHHTGSHYHMAGSKQFQKGVRVPGVVSRHSQQGAKLQAARVSQRNARTAREDARGERAVGAGKKAGKTRKKKKAAAAEK